MSTQALNQRRPLSDLTATAALAWAQWVQNPVPCDNQSPPGASLPQLRHFLTRRDTLPPQLIAHLADGEVPRPVHRTQELVLEDAAVAEDAHGVRAGQVGRREVAGGYEFREPLDFHPLDGLDAFSVAGFLGIQAGLDFSQR